MANEEEKNFSKMIIVMSVVIVTVALYFIMTATFEDKPMVGRGAEIDRNPTADIGGEFTLTNQEGEEYSSDQLKGKISMVYFGFSACPDICPASVQKMTDVSQTLGKYNIDVVPVFVSLDPQRDKPEILKKFLSSYDKKFIGLTGTEDQVRSAADLFKVFYALAAGSDKNSDDYILDHTSLIYIMDQNFNYKSHFHIDSKPEEIIEYIRQEK